MVIASLRRLIEGSSDWMEATPHFRLGVIFGMVGPGPQLNHAFFWGARGGLGWLNEDHIKPHQDISVCLHTLIPLFASVQ